MSETSNGRGRAGGEANGSDGRSRSEEKLEKLLSAAAGLIARQGYGQTSIRDVARETGFSLAGMYYYFENKEDLLYQIQHRTFGDLLAEQKRVVAGEGDPREKFARLVSKHLSYFTRHTSEMKICAFEMYTLQDERYQDIEALRRDYYRCMAQVVAELLGASAESADRDGRVRHYTLFIFGMLNWIFMWYDPERDVPAEKLGEEMLALLMRGLVGAN
jgi:TetR/AcrR family transcriptional regulator